MKPAAVLTFINVINGRYRWWDEFPSMIGERLGRAGVEHICFYRDYDEHAATPPEARHPTPEGSLGVPSWLRDHVRPVAARFDKVIFHTHGHYQPIWMGLEVRHHRRARWLWTEHRISEPRRLDWLRKSARSVVQGSRTHLLPDRLYGVSEAGAARLRQQFRSSSVKCVRTGVRLLAVPPRAREAASRPPGQALFVGRLIPEKGIWPLLRAFALLRDRDADVTLTLVGPGPREEVDRFIVANRLQDRVTVAGYQREVRPFYEQADFAIVPTLVPEALGMVSLEARMYGLPAIYSRRGGLPETQVEGVTGLCLAQITPEEIAAKVVELQSDPARYAEMSRRAPEGLADFSIEHMVDAYVKEYLADLASL